MRNRAPRTTSVPPQKTLSSGEVLLSETRERLPTLTDELELPSNETTEATVSPSDWPTFASAPLPPGLDARFDIGGWQRPLASVRTVIGRGKDADLQINDPKASRKHASVLYTGTEFRIRDQGSANGTLLNGSKVVEYAIRDGDELQVGDTVLRFRVRMQP